MNISDVRKSQNRSTGISKWDMWLILIIALVLFAPLVPSVFNALSEIVGRAIDQQINERQAAADQVPVHIRLLQLPGDRP